MHALLTNHNVFGIKYNLALFKHIKSIVEHIPIYINIINVCIIKVLNFILFFIWYSNKLKRTYFRIMSLKPTVALELLHITHIIRRQIIFYFLKLIIIRHWKGKLVLHIKITLIMYYSADQDF